MRIPNWFLTAVMCIVVLAWGCAVGYGFVNPDYKMPDAISAAFSAIVGLVLAQAGRQVSKNRKDDDNDDGKKNDKSEQDGTS